jgi:hypothetical protein
MDGELTPVMRAIVPMSQAKPTAASQSLATNPFSGRTHAFELERFPFTVVHGNRC